MRPQWFDIKDIPYEQMWEDDKIWLPELLKGQDPFYGRIYIKRKPLEVEGEEEEGKVTVAAAAPSSTSNVSLTMATVPFTTAQPKSGPFTMFDYRLDLNLSKIPKEIAFDGTIASYED